jgi:hypothetical protein
MTQRKVANMRNAIWKVMRKTVSFTAIALAGCVGELGVEDEPVASAAAESAASEEDEAVPDVFEATEGEVTIAGNKDCTFGLACIWPKKNRTGTKVEISFSGSGGANHCKERRLTVGTATNSFGGGVIGMELFTTSNCTGVSQTVHPGDEFEPAAPTYPMGSYLIRR